MLYLFDIFASKLEFNLFMSVATTLTCILIASTNDNKNTFLLNHNSRAIHLQTTNTTASKYF